jgi:hypothetical protein
MGETGLLGHTKIEKVLLIMRKTIKDLPALFVIIF